MSWYKINKIANGDPIRYIQYNSDITGWDMFVTFKRSKQVYRYRGVSPFIYESIEKLRGHKNYSKVSQILLRLSGGNEKKPIMIAIQYTNIVWGELSKEEAASYQTNLPEEILVPKVTTEELKAFGPSGVLKAYFGVKPESFDHEVVKRK